MATPRSSTLYERAGVRWGVLGVVLVLLLAPVVLDADDYPLSTYPMYSTARPSEVSLVTADGVDADGERVRLDLATIGATDDPLIAAGELRAAIRNGDATRRCREIAARVEAGRGTSDVEIVGVEIVTETRDVIESTLGRPGLLARDVHATCEVGQPS